MHLTQMQGTFARGYRIDEVPERRSETTGRYYRRDQVDRNVDDMISVIGATVGSLWSL